MGKKETGDHAHGKTLPVVADFHGHDKGSSTFAISNRKPGAASASGAQGTINAGGRYNRGSCRVRRRGLRESLHSQKCRRQAIPLNFDVNEAGVA